MSELTFQEKMHQVVEHAIIDVLRKGEWLSLPYDKRIGIDQTLLRQAYAAINMKRVVELITPEIESRIADQIIGSLATEINTDVKKIMSNGELREDLRAVIREKIRETARGVQKEKP